MKKQPIIEDAMKTVIRDELALRPLASVHKVQIELFVRGFRSVSGKMLDWHYIAKFVRKVRIENLEKIPRSNRIERLAALKERHRILTEKLVPIVEGDLIYTPLGASYPTQRDRISAANTIMKWDLALFFAEEQINLLDKTQTIEKKRTRAVIMTDTISETRMISQPPTNNFPKRKMASHKMNVQNREGVTVDGGLKERNYFPS